MRRSSIRWRASWTLSGLWDDSEKGSQDSMKIETMVLGEVRTNCYLLIQEETKEALVVDPADRADVIIRKAREEGVTLKAMLLTHGHGDHILAVADLKRELGLKVYAAQEELELLGNPDWNLSKALFGAAVTVEPDVLLFDGQEFTEAGLKIRMLSTPGHTPGGCCYYLPKEQVLFSGDTLFSGSIGRTDFPGGSLSTLVRSVKENLLVLPEDVKVYPGHEEMTTIGHEKKYNPYMG